jgi:hypothetical protein
VKIRACETWSRCVRYGVVVYFVLSYGMFIKTITYASNGATVIYFVPSVFTAFARLATRRSQPGRTHAVSRPNKPSSPMSRYPVSVCRLVQCVARASPLGPDGAVFEAAGAPGLPCIAPAEGTPICGLTGGWLKPGRCPGAAPGPVDIAEGTPACPGCGGLTAAAGSAFTSLASLLSLAPTDAPGAVAPRGDVVELRIGMSTRSVGPRFLILLSAH